MYTVYYTYTAHLDWQDGGVDYYTDFDCAEDVETFEEVQALIADLEKNHCFNIFWYSPKGQYNGR